MSDLGCPFAWIEEERRSVQPRLTCIGCGGPLRGRQSKWCSRECSEIYAVNHFWTNARRRAIERDGERCVRCGAGAGRARLLSGLVTFLAPACAISEVDVEHWLYRTHPEAWAADLAVALKVNHVEPRRGRGYGAGCAHHQDNLEVVCRPCHLDVTDAQRGGYRGSARDLPFDEQQLLALA